MPWLALKLILGGLFKTITTFIAENWRWFIPLCALLATLWYIHHLQGQRDAAVNALASYVQAANEATAKQKADNLAKENAAKATLGAISTIHQAEIVTLRKQYEHANKTDQAAADGRIDLWRDRVRLEVARNADGMRQIPDPAGQPAEKGRDCHATDSRQAYDTLEIACAITTSDYNTLHESWDKACEIYGCQ